MKTVICILALALSVKAGLLPHHADEIQHLADGPHYGDLHHAGHHHGELHHANLHHGELHHADLHHGDVHHSDSGIHLGHSSAIVIDAADRPLVEQHPVYHHDSYRAAAVSSSVDVHHAPAAQIIHHGAIHQVEPVHHVTKVVHHEPHHFLHYTKPEVDHHVVHQNEHVDEHQHAADLHHSELHHHGAALHHVDSLLHHDAAILHHDAAHNAAIVHHHNAAPLVHSVDHHHHAAALVHHHHLPLTYQRHHAAAVVHKVYPGNNPVTHSDILAFAKHHLHGKFGKLRITEKHY